MTTPPSGTPSGRRDPTPANDTEGRTGAAAAGAGAGLSAEAELARRLLRARESLGEALGADLFGDPAWGILLELFVAGERGELLTDALVGAAAGTPDATAARWVLALEKRGHLVRTGAEGDRRGSHYGLTRETAQTMRALLRSWL